jgi:hypothetical protein
MAEQKNTLSDLLKRLTVDANNMNAFLYSLSNMLESKSENVTVSQYTEDGSQYTITVPSFGYLKGKIEDINNKFDSLLSANGDTVGVKSSNGDIRKFELKKISQLVSDLDNIENVTLNLPNSFKVRNNWFFESFLNPLLFVTVDISSFLTQDIDRFVVKRIIINSADDDAVAFFRENYRGQTNIDLEDLKLDLSDNGYDFFEDDNVVDLEIPVNRYRGSFDIVKQREETVAVTSGTETSSVIRRVYKLSTLNYTDILDSVQNTRILSEGDVLITANDSEYIVRSVNKTTKEVVLERTYGLDPLTIGANQLRVKPVPYRIPELRINVGFNEHEVIFIRPVSKANNLTTDSFSKGFGIYTNELTITLEDDSQTTLERYYNNFVADFGLILLNAAKERKLPAVIAATPDSPVLDSSNFSVVQINAHIKEDQGALQIKAKIAEKERIKSEISEKDKKIEDIKSKISAKETTQKEKRRLDKDLTKAVKDRGVLQSQLATSINSITLDISVTPAFITTPKFRVRGFWNIPDPKVTEYGTQTVVQFKYRYRYLSKKGTTPNAVQQKFVDTNGTKKFATFSSWTEVLTKPRQRVLDETTGLYIWAEEAVTDSEAVNSNQLDIAINKGEIVEIQVMSLSEAGWPDNPAQSDWSNSVQVTFPDDIESEEENTILAQKTYAENAKVQFEDSLTAKGLDLHLLNQFTTGERFFGHQSKDIASGFFTPEGNVVDLFEQLKGIAASLEALQKAIATEAGEIKVIIIDPDGNEISVNQGQTVELFAGYYKDQIKDTIGDSIVYRHGEIITKQYIMQIQNVSATPLELISILKGGIDEISPESDPIAYPEDDYHLIRQYDKVPIGISSISESTLGSFKHTPKAQSAQVKSQYVYSRFKDYGLSKELYAQYPSSGYSTANVSTYNFQGITVGSNLVPLNWAHYLPYNPTLNWSSTFPTTNSNVWNGVSSTLVGLPTGGGYVTEFALHVNHPYVRAWCASNPGTTLASGSNLEDFFLPEFEESGGSIVSSAGQKYLPVSHAPFFETRNNETQVLGGVNNQQAIRPNVNDTVAANLNTNRGTDNYPVKLGFVPDDQYLIGKYTCGAYLNMMPNSYEIVSVEGNHPLLSVKKVATGAVKAINVPIVFQYRCSDILKNVGGYRKNENLNQVQYTRTVGIDVFIKDASPFSFDLTVSAKYQNETTFQGIIAPGIGNIVNFK